MPFCVLESGTRPAAVPPPETWFGRRTWTCLVSSPPPRTPATAMDPRCEGGLRGRWYESEWMRWKWAQIHLEDDELALTIALACVPQGFYSVYSSVFANLAKAEAASSKQAGSHAAFGASRVQRGFAGACDIFLQEQAWHPAARGVVPKHNLNTLPQARRARPGRRSTPFTTTGPGLCPSATSRGRMSTTCGRHRTARWVRRDVAEGSRPTDALLFESRSALGASTLHDTKPATTLLLRTTRCGA